MAIADDLPIGRADALFWGLAVQNIGFELLNSHWVNSVVQKLIPATLA
jgi:hypothetical protein